jgi:hypothetical protein
MSGGSAGVSGGSAGKASGGDAGARNDGGPDAHDASHSASTGGESGSPDAALPDATVADAAAKDANDSSDTGATGGVLRLQVTTNGTVLVGRLAGNYVHNGLTTGICATPRCHKPVPEVEQDCVDQCFIPDVLPAPTCSQAPSGPPDGTCTFLVDAANAGATVNIQAPGSTFTEVTPVVDPTSASLLCSVKDDQDQGPYYSCLLLVPKDPTLLTLEFSQP